MVSEPLFLASQLRKSRGRAHTAALQGLCAPLATCGGLHCPMHRQPPWAAFRGDRRVSGSCCPELVALGVLTCWGREGPFPCALGSLTHVRPLTGRWSLDGAECPSLQRTHPVRSVRLATGDDSSPGAPTPGTDGERSRRSFHGAHDPVSESPPCGRKVRHQPRPPV